MRGSLFGNPLLLTAHFLSVLAASEQQRPRGVGPEFAKYYKSSDHFECIFNPSITLSVDQVNDDYCDCPDGSDEPGTSACSHLSPLSPLLAPEISADTANSTLALPGFYCKNKGHIPGYVPFTDVNDGICDHDLCCDGSDEWAGVGGLKCDDRCKEIGKEWRKMDELRQKSANTANRKRKELVTEGARLRLEVQDRIQTLTTQLEGSRVKVANLEKILADVEREERLKVVKAPKEGGKLGILTGLAKERIDEMKSQLTRVRSQRDAGRGRISELEEILRAFKDEYDPNFNDEGVKRAVKKWEDYATRDKEPDDSASERDLDDVLSSDAEINWAEFETEEESEVAVLYKFEEYLPPSLREWLDTKLRDLRTYLIDNGVLAPGSASSAAGESAAVTAARSALSSAESEQRTLENDLKSHREDLDADYGPDGVLRALKGRCISMDSGEYTYELCFMTRTTQKSKKGSGNTGMGNFARIDFVTVDEDVPADGRGLGSGTRIALRYENGQHCWDGPSRSTTVVLACAEEDEIWKVTEEEKCVYRMEVGSPAGCEAPAAKQPEGGAKDEL